MKFAHSKSKINHNHTKKSNGLRVADKKSQPPRHEVIRAAEVKNCFEPRIARIYTTKRRGRCAVEQPEVGPQGEMSGSERVK